MRPSARDRIIAAVTDQIRRENRLLAIRLDQIGDQVAGYGVACIHAIERIRREQQGDVVHLENAPPSVHHEMNVQERPQDVVQAFVSHLEQLQKDPSLSKDKQTECLINLMSDQVCTEDPSRVSVLNAMGLSLKTEWEYALGMIERWREVVSINPTYTLLERVGRLKSMLDHLPVGSEGRRVCLEQIQAIKDVLA